MKRQIALGLILSVAFASPVAAAPYTVGKSDTLYSISKRFGTSIAVLKQKNNLQTDTIKAGQVLEIPHGAVATSRSATKEPTTRYVAVGKTSVSSVTSGNLTAKTTIKVATSLPVIKEETKKVAQPTEMSGIIEPLLGTPYKWGGVTTDGFDCSGFTSYVFAEMGVELPRTSQAQFTTGEAVDAEAPLEPGDLLFFDADKKGTVTHVGIYVGDNKMAHAATKSVRIDDLDWYLKNYTYYGAKRVF
ncbi:LysM domain-containing protein [Aneurinibacillus soli]|uniref:Putative peptidoglycan endopeptidase LytE n=1 Tax=Aneurinibacillus soli TaxID=1500254 RepID=A0A0U5AY34_9BACL|nr:C40 family peptidase [Aneurinibacillus soli]PYE62155.1 LysM domain-containing protein [Aneurinibacillus soli]BAU28657.1 putative peptidoglycan endopeptidase LytE precursor [Aneurinibacillus soli]